MSTVTDLAFQALGSVLIAEARRYAETPEGKKALASLEDIALHHVLNRVAEAPADAGRAFVDFLKSHPYASREPSTQYDGYVGG